MQSLCWGIIGPGNIAHDFAHDLALVTPAQTITAVLGTNEEKAQAFAKEFSAEQAYTNLDDFLQHKNIDVVYIATPHPDHYQKALACLQNNIAVLCEKPLTVNQQQAKELIAASHQSNCFLMEAMWIRFLPGINKVLELIEEDRIGKIVSIKASMGYKAPENENSRYFDPALGGGSLLDLGIYPIFLSHLLLGKPSSIKAVGKLTDKGVDESCSVILDYDGKAQALLDSTIISQSELPAEIAGENGIIRILYPWFEKSPGIELQLYNQEKQRFSTKWEGHGLQFEIHEVLKCISQQKIESDVFPHAFSLELIETMDEIRKQIDVVYAADVSAA